MALTIHDFLDHEHTVCISKTENHIHKKELSCELHLVKQTNPFLFNNSFSLKRVSEVNKPFSNSYTFLKNHPQLSFSLRGPPYHL